MFSTDFVSLWGMFTNDLFIRSFGNSPPEGSLCMISTQFVKGVIKGSHIGGEARAHSGAHLRESPPFLRVRKRVTKRQPFWRPFLTLFIPCVQ